MHVPFGRDTVGVMTDIHEDDDTTRNPSDDEGRQDAPQAETAAGRPKPAWKRGIRNGALLLGAVGLTAGLWLLLRRGMPAPDSAPIENAAEEIRSIGRTVQVSDHLRKLPEGWQASLRKIAEAAEKGVSLPDGYTYVDGHTRTI